MNIRRIPGQPFAYYAESREKPGTYHHVDLLAETCNCRDWSCRHRKEKERTGQSYRCRHIRACREMEMDSILEYSREQIHAR